MCKVTLYREMTGRCDKMIREEVWKIYVFCVGLNIFQDFSHVTLSKGRQGYVIR